MIAGRPDRRYLLIGLAAVLFVVNAVLIVGAPYHASSRILGVFLVIMTTVTALRAVLTSQQQQYPLAQGLVSMYAGGAILLSGYYMAPGNLADGPMQAMLGLAGGAVFYAVYRGLDRLVVPPAHRSSLKQYLQVLTGEPADTGTKRIKDISLRDDPMYTELTRYHLAISGLTAVLTGVYLLGGSLLDWGLTAVILIGYAVIRVGWFLLPWIGLVPMKAVENGVVPAHTDAQTLSELDDDVRDMTLRHLTLLSGFSDGWVVSLLLGGIIMQNGLIPLFSGNFLAQAYLIFIASVIGSILYIKGVERYVLPRDPTQK